MTNTVTQFSGIIYPDKSFSIGTIPKKRKGRAERLYNHQWANQEEPDINAKIDWLINVTSVGGKFCSLGESPLLVKGSELSQKPPKKYGNNGITRYGRKVCTNSALLLQKEYARIKLGFMTCTLPKISKSVSALLLDKWGEVVRRYLQKLKRICNKKGSDFIYIGCTEIQEKRFKKTLIAVPHLHVVYVSKAKRCKDYLFNTKQAYEAWNESVNQVLIKNGIDAVMGIGEHKGSVKLERIHKSAAGYIGKYISKGSQCVKSMMENGYSVFPRQWWFASMQMKDKFKKSLIRLSQDECKAIFYGCEHYLHEQLIVWVRFVDITLGDKYVTVGLTGMMSKNMYQAFKT